MRMIFINLPVADLSASKAFYEGLGFTCNPQFTDETAACMVISETIFVMLLTHDKFRGFIKNDMATRDTTEVLLALSSESREAVDQMVEAAIANGGEPWRDPQDHGWMYERSFRDPDGHVWETLWMDEAAAAGGPPEEGSADPEKAGPGWPKSVEGGAFAMHDRMMATEPDNAFVAEQTGPPPRRYWIARDGPVTSSAQTRGWTFVYEEMSEDGLWGPGWDTWEEFFFEVLRYPSAYSTEALIWRSVSTAAVIDLASLQPHFDGKAVRPDQTPEEAGLRLPR